MLACVLRHYAGGSGCRAKADRGCRSRTYSGSVRLSGCFRFIHLPYAGFMVTFLRCNDGKARQGYSEAKETVLDMAMVVVHLWPLALKPRAIVARYVALSAWMERENSVLLSTLIAM